MIPDDWSLLILPNSNRKYYYNHMTGESRWKVHIAGGPYDIPVFPKHPVEPERSTCTPQQKCHSLNDGLDSHRHHQKKSRQTAFLTPPRVDRHISRDDLPNSLPKPKPRKSSSITSRHRKSHSCVIGRSDPPINTIQNTSTSNHFVQRNAENETKPDNYNKDYIKLSEDYKRMEQFRSSQHPISTGPTPTCINCRSRGVRIDKVFFPCEHCCICLRCLKKLMPKKCPLCNETIRAIFDLDNAHESYWNWVEEVKPAISTKFLQGFFVESKNSIRTELMKRRHSLKTNRATEEMNAPELRYCKWTNRSIFSCWQYLLGRRASSCAPEGL